MNSIANLQLVQRTMRIMGNLGYHSSHLVAMVAAHLGTFLTSGPDNGVGSFWKRGQWEVTLGLCCLHGGSCVKGKRARFLKRQWRQKPWPPPSVEQWQWWIVTELAKAIVDNFVVSFSQQKDILVQFDWARSKCLANKLPGLKSLLAWVSLQSRYKTYAAPYHTNNQINPN